MLLYIMSKLPVILVLLLWWISYAAYLLDAGLILLYIIAPMLDKILLDINAKISLSPFCHRSVTRFLPILHQPVTDLLPIWPFTSFQKCVTLLPD